MEFNFYIAPLTIIIVQLLKPLKFIDPLYIPHISCVLGVAGGLLFAVIYDVDYFVHAVNGFFAGASAAGLYDVSKSTKIALTGGK